jgi:hypothetical protein
LEILRGVGVLCRSRGGSDNLVIGCILRRQLAAIQILVIPQGCILPFLLFGLRKRGEDEHEMTGWKWYAVLAFVIALLVTFYGVMISMALR